MKMIPYILIFSLLCGCDDSKWESIDGFGISDDHKSLDNAIYFENESIGVIGGYELIPDPTGRFEDGLAPKPILFLTEDGGEIWSEIVFDTLIYHPVTDLYLKGDTLICQLDSIIFLSSDKGFSFRQPKGIEEGVRFSELLHACDCGIKQENFFFGSKKYSVKTCYRNKLVSVIICYGEEVLTDYYFVSFDNEKTWKFLQKSMGSNRERFLIEDKYLYEYDLPFGLRRLKLK